jgi:hypothetical protein
MADSLNSSDTPTPFGASDGSKANLDELLRDFVQFDSRSYGDGIGARHDDLSIRVIVGAKGSGKSAYLRRLHAEAKRRDDVYTDPDIPKSPPPTDSVMKFSSFFDRHALPDMWRQLWHCAVLRSVLSHVLNEDRLRTSAIPQKTYDKMEEIAKKVGLSRTPASVYASATAVMSPTRRSDASYTRYLFDPQWGDIEYYLGQVIHDLPPLYFFLDSGDEGFEEAPMHWLQCQKGLFHSVMRFLRHQLLGGRLHIVITIRDHVLASVYRSEHQSRYRGDPHIRLLDWSWEAVQQLLIAKISRLDPRYLCAPNSPAAHQLTRWLGLTTIRNRRRELDEDLSDYLLRHTLLLPRDIVILGNRLCNEGLRVKASGRSQMSEHEVRAIVAEEARRFGDDQLKICARQIVSSGVPHEATRYEYSALYTANDEHRRDVSEKLKALIRVIGKDRFNLDELMKARTVAEQHFGEGSDALSALWQNRLIGFRNPRADQAACAEVFFSERFLDEFNIPLDKQEYYFHPCIIDAVHIESVVDRPLTPGKTRALATARPQV